MNKPIKEIRQGEQLAESQVFSELVKGQEYSFGLSEQRTFKGKFLGKTQVYNYPETYVFEDENGYAFVRNIAIKDGKVILNEEAGAYYETHKLFDLLGEDSALVQMVNKCGDGI